MCGCVRLTAGRAWSVWQPALLSKSSLRVARSDDEAQIPGRSGDWSAATEAPVVLVLHLVQATVEGGRGVISGSEGYRGGSGGGGGVVMMVVVVVVVVVGSGSW